MTKIVDWRRMGQIGEEWDVSLRWRRLEMTCWMHFLKFDFSSDGNLVTFVVAIKTLTSMIVRIVSIENFLFPSLLSTASSFFCLKIGENRQIQVFDQVLKEFENLLVAFRFIIRN